MPVAFALGTGIAGVATTVVMARRAARERRLRFSRLFEDCGSLFETSRITLGLDGFPRLDGLSAGRFIRATVVPDSLTLKRLPQLWLHVTRAVALPVEGDFALLARPNGAEFYALTHRMARRLDVPSRLPPALMARGTGPDSQALLDSLVEPLSAIFEDTRLKEFAVTRRGLRAVIQAAEGKRGEHLLLRQSAFDGPIPLTAFQASLESLALIEAALPGACAAPGRVLEGVAI